MIVVRRDFGRKLETVGLDIYWISAGYRLDIYWISAGYLLDICWISTGYLLDIY